jgi:LysR family transcriptional regulator, nitrogen assimilation regulatory protein
MDDEDRPVRTHAAAARADDELIAVLREMSTGAEPITARSVARQMRSLAQASSLVRDSWRSKQIGRYELIRLSAISGSVEAFDVRKDSEQSIRLAPSSRELRTFTYFMALAEMGHFGRAALLLGISQSALSQHITAFERELGGSLFSRHSRGVSLTPAGAKLREILNIVIPMLTTPLAVTPESSGPPDTLRIGAPFEYAAVVMPPVVDDLRRRWPSLQVEVKDFTASDLVEALLARFVDIAVLPNTPHVDGLAIQFVAEEELGVVGVPSAPGARDRTPLRIRDLAKLDVILPSKRHPFSRELDRVCSQHNVQVSPSYRTDSFALRVELVRKWNSRTILPASVVRHGLVHGNIFFRPLADAVTVRLGLAFHVGLSLQGRLPQIMEVIRASTVKSLIAFGSGPDS